MRYFFMILAALLALLYVRFLETDYLIGVGVCVLVAVFLTLDDIYLQLKKQNK